MHLPVGLVFPHQLFKQSPALQNVQKVYLVEEYLFFKQYSFHKQKIVFHRASMKFYESYLASTGLQVEYIDSFNPLSDIRKLIPYLASEGHELINYVDPTDDWLKKRLIKTAEQSGVKLTEFESPLFLNKRAELSEYFTDREKFFQTDFYIAQRKKRGILMEGKKPVGGKWSFDAENRSPFPKTAKAPVVNFPVVNDYYRQAIQYTERYFNTNLGELSETFVYPTTYTEAEVWLEQFLQERFELFGKYEDAIVSNKSILHHSVLTPMLNVVLVTPGYVVQSILKVAAEREIPLSSVEGIIRQIIGWREFIRGVYEYAGVKERTINYWNFKRKIPAGFYNATTGIVPFDTVLKKVLKTGYCHHIERLMILGNFMLLCEFDPDEVYKWFMELFIDSYDWVMVPNVYGMSQFADGGLMSTKPYISGSNYIKKMSDFGDGEWAKIWDALFWRFMHVHRSFFLQNPRLGMLVGTFDKMPEAKRNYHLQAADNFLQGL
jgi:deoxyribodipyrimidine photolyase-related protein